MFISLVLGHKKCFMGIYLEMLIFGVKIKLRNACACKREGRALFMILRFRFESIYFDNKKGCYILLNKFLFSVAERIK